jgi:hypothetical protein
VVEPTARAQRMATAWQRVPSPPAPPSILPLPQSEGWPRQQPGKVPEPIAALASTLFASGTAPSITALWLGPGKAEPEGPDTFHGSPILGRKRLDAQAAWRTVALLGDAFNWPSESGGGCGCCGGWGGFVLRIEEDGRTLDLGIDLEGSVQIGSPDYPVYPSEEGMKRVRALLDEVFPVAGEVRRLEERSSCLGPICLDPLPERLEAEDPGPGETTTYCYPISPVRGTLRVEVHGGRWPAVASSLLLTREPICQATHMGFYDDHQEIRTCRGIKLGDTVAEVYRLHGKPVHQDDAGYPWSDAPPGVAQMDFMCLANRPDLPVTSVYVEDGIVVGIAVRGIPH